MVGRAPPSCVAVLLLLCLAQPSKVTLAFHFADPTERVVQTFDSALPRKLLPEIAREARAVHKNSLNRPPVQKGNWMPIEQFENPRSHIELAITYLHKMAFPEDSPWTGGGPDGIEPTQLAGAEWWVQNIDTKGDLDFHYDKDEGVASEEFWMKMPTMSSVLYLTDTGAPTMVLNKTTDKGGTKLTPIVPSTGYFSYPRKNRYLLFKGDLGHMVVGSFGQKKRGKNKKGSRLTFLVNYWDEQPMQPYCREVHDSTWIDMVGQKSMDSAAAVWPGVRSRAPGYEAAHTKVRPKELRVADGGATLGMDQEVEMRYKAEELILHETGEPQTRRFFFDYPKPSQVATRELYEVTWGTGHVFGNIEELDVNNQMIMGKLATPSKPMVILWVDEHERPNLERAQLLPVATEYTGRLDFFSAIPKNTVGVLAKYGLTVEDTPTVVLLDPLGAYGAGNNKAWLPPPSLRGSLNADALRQFLVDPSQEEGVREASPPPPPPVGGGTEEPVLSSDLEAQVSAVYKRHDPSKLHKVPSILFRYKGREDQLLPDLHAKYPEATAADNPLDGHEMGTVVERVTRYYELFLPSKLSTLSKILFRYKGKDAQLLEDMRAKYGGARQGGRYQRESSRSYTDL